MGGETPLFSASNLAVAHSLCFTFSPQTDAMLDALAARLQQIRGLDLISLGCSIPSIWQTTAETVEPWRSGEGRGDGPVELRPNFSGG
jgi:hypothetical protein